MQKVCVPPNNINHANNYMFPTPLPLFFLFLIRYVLIFFLLHFFFDWFGLRGRGGVGVLGFFSLFRSPFLGSFLHAS